MVIKRSNSGWQVDTQPGGRGARRHRKTFSTKAEALQYETWVKGQYQQTPEWIPAKKDRRPLSTLIDIWYQIHGNQLRDGARRQRLLLYGCMRMMDPIASDLTSDRFVAYRAERIKSGLTPAAANREHAYFRALFNELKRTGHWKGVNPIASVRQFKVQETELAFLTLEQIRGLLDLIERSGSIDALLVTKICLAAGTRWSEAEQLRLAQLRDGHIYLSQTKSKKNRAVPIDDALHHEIVTHHKARNGNDWRSVQTFFRPCVHPFRKALAASGIELPSGQLTHVLRHTFASHFMMNGGNILALQKILGHSTLAMTMRYAHLAPDHLQEAKRLNPLATLLG